MKNCLKFLIVAIVVMTSSGCITVGKPIPANVIDNIVVGETTKQMILTQLGEPDRIGVDSGYRTATYLYYRVGLLKKMITTDLLVVFDHQDKVKSYSYNTNEK